MKSLCAYRRVKPCVESEALVFKSIEVLLILCCEKKHTCEVMGRFFGKDQPSSTSPFLSETGLLCQDKTSRPEQDERSASKHIRGPTTIYRQLLMGRFYAKTCSEGRKSWNNPRALTVWAQAPPPLGPGIFSGKAQTRLQKLSWHLRRPPKMVKLN